MNPAEALEGNQPVAATKVEPAGAVLNGKAVGRAAALGRIATGVALLLILPSVFVLQVETLRDSFQFAEEAIRQAGDTPPARVALRLESLRRWQGVGNASLLLGCMGSTGAIFFLACLKISSIKRVSSRNASSMPIALWKLAFQSLVLGALIGLFAGGVGWWLFRMRPMGEQNLIITSLFQSIAWGTLGLACSLSVNGLCRSSRSSIGNIAGFASAWGLINPAILTILLPVSYLGTLVPNEFTARILWGAGGGLFLGIGMLRSSIFKSSFSPHSAIVDA